MDGFSGFEDFFPLHKPICGFSCSENSVFLLFHTPFAGFAIETFCLLGGSTELSE